MGRSPGTADHIARLGLIILVGATSACARARPSVQPRPATPESAAPVSGTVPRDAGSLLAGKSLMVPVLGVDPAGVVDSYTAGRGGGRTHSAIDIMAPRGTPVLAAEDGTILKLRSNDAGGITIYQLDPSGGFVYYYAHLDRYERGLAEGMNVRQGQIIGYVGTSGNAPENLPHLHFQMMIYRGGGRYWGGEPVNPNSLFRQSGNGR